MRRKGQELDRLHRNGIISHDCYNRNDLFVCLSPKFFAILIATKEKPSTRQGRGTQQKMRMRPLRMRVPFPISGSSYNYYPYKVLLSVTKKKELNENSENFLVSYRIHPFKSFLIDLGLRINPGIELTKRLKTPVL